MTVESYRFGQMVIDGRTYHRDVMILPGRVCDGWWRETGHRLSIADLEEAFKAKAQVLVIGTGFSGLMQVPAETSRELGQRGIELHVLHTAGAWALYNQLVSGDRRVVAAFHLSC